MSKKLLPSKGDDISKWYIRVIQVADLADYGPAKGTMIFKPYGYALWKRVKEELDKFIQERGVEEAYFPMFIPESLIEKEKTHVEGFSPELAVVTIGGGEELEERLVIRPTSETIMYDSYAKWIHSWRDLPMMINQWNNVVRWEKKTTPFLRTSEFLWQEGHTAHATYDEALQTQKWAMETYEKLYKDFFALYGYVGYKSKEERFAGSVSTLTYEALMPSGKALQNSTSHDLGQNFSKAFDITYQDKQGKEEYVWQTCWGLSTRALGGLILMHGDDNGLRLPPKLAPVQAIVLPVRTEPKITEYAQQITDSLDEKGVRVKQDGREEETIGFRINKWEVKGVPLRLEVGENELKEGSVTVARRDTGEKSTVKKDELTATVKELLEKIQDNLYQQSRNFTEKNTKTAQNYDEFKQIVKKHKGFIKVYWEEDSEVEKRIHEETTASSRCRLPEESDGVCFMTGKPTKQQWLFAQSY